MKVSDYIVSFFENVGLQHVFMVTGGGSMHLNDSFGKSLKIQYICTHHEQSAGMAAEAYAKMNNDLGLVVVTSGPGGTNVITALLGAYQDSIPCIFISGQGKRKLTIHNSGVPLRQFGIQEVNIIPIVQPITKYSVMINNPNEIRYHLEKSYAIAKFGRPGPVWLDIPLDVQSAEINVDDLDPYEGYTISNNLSLKNRDTEYVVDALKNAIRPVIVAGHGIRLAGGSLIFEELINLLKIPVVTPIMGIDLLPSNHKMNIGRIGIKGTRAGNFTMQNADFLLCIGTRLSIAAIGYEYELFAREAEIIVVDIDKEEHMKKTININKFIHVDAKDFLLSLLEKSKNWDTELHSKWLSFCQKQKKKYPVCLESYSDDSNGINYYKFVDLVTNFISSDVSIVSDAGSSFYVVSQAANIKPNQRYITSGALATMGFALPAAIGVSFASRKGPVVVITGDGSFNQNPQELAVVAYHKLPIKLFVTDNNGYISVRDTQRRIFNNHFVGESPESGIFFPNLELLSRAYGIQYLLIDSLKILEEKLPIIFSDSSPVVIDIKVDRNQRIIPRDSAVVLNDGRIVSKPLEDMYPFLPDDEFYENMKVKPLR
jgi:acetolactate synthase-1/2/3 large subunit